MLVGPRTPGKKLMLSLQNLDHCSIIATYAHVVFMVFSGNVSWQQGARAAAHGPVQQPHVEAQYPTIYAVEGLNRGLYMRECSCLPAPAALGNNIWGSAVACLTC